jgi:hypothetical protein
MKKHFSKIAATTMAPFPLRKRNKWKKKQRLTVMQIEKICLSQRLKPSTWMQRITVRRLQSNY